MEIGNRGRPGEKDSCVLTVEEFYGVKNFNYLGILITEEGKEGFEAQER